MLIRYSVNLAAHLVAGVVFGVMAVALADQCLRRRDEEGVVAPPPAPGPVPPSAEPRPAEPPM